MKRGDLTLLTRAELVRALAMLRGVKPEDIPATNMKKFDLIDAVEAAKGPSDGFWPKGSIVVFDKEEHRIHGYTMGGQYVVVERAAYPSSNPNDMRKVASRYIINHLTDEVLIAFPKKRKKIPA